MSMTLWIHLRDGDSMTEESGDYSTLYRFADDLGALCRRLGTAELSSFFDMTGFICDPGSDITGNLCNSDGEEESEECSYGIDDMEWFAASAGLETMRALKNHLSAVPAESIGDMKCAAVIEELDELIRQLQESAARDGNFNLAVIM